ncbi:hypothetical protein GGF46_004864 [Coemansia sp. RSA 552]|nr:hypothetical protein GGF46_004864 [Coemansia sp. RSA 552]
MITDLARILRKAPPSRLYRLKMDGLYGTSTLQHGNNKPKSLHKTRRTWFPNIQKVSLYSVLLDAKLKFNATTRVIRTIDKKGGLDNYLLNTKDKNIVGEFGLRLKDRLLKKLEAKKVE